MGGVSFDDIGGYHSIKKRLIQLVQVFYLPRIGDEPTSFSYFVFNNLCFEHSGLWKIRQVSRGSASTDFLESVCLANLVVEKQASSGLFGTVCAVNQPESSTLTLDMSSRNNRGKGAWLLNVKLALLLFR